MPSPPLKKPSGIENSAILFAFYINARYFKSMIPLVRSTIFFIIATLVSSVTWSATDGGPSAQQLRAEKRQFPGGIDEEDLQVQKELPEPQPKVTRRAIEQKVYGSFFKEEKAYEDAPENE